MMDQAGDRMKALEPFVGRWSMQVDMPGMPDMSDQDMDAEVTFEWMPGGRFLVERWTVPIPEAPDGLAVIYHDNPGHLPPALLRLPGRGSRLRDGL